MRGLIHPGLFTFPEHRGPVGAALIGSCLTVAKNKLISLQLFLQPQSSLSHRQPTVPSCLLGSTGGKWGGGVRGLVQRRDPVSVSQGVHTDRQTDTHAGTPWQRQLPGGLTALSTPCSTYQRQISNQILWEKAKHSLHTDRASYSKPQS